MNICIILSRGLSLHKWSELGIIERELQVYKELVNHGHNITLITFGNSDDNNYLHNNNLKIDVVPYFSRINRPKLKLLRIIYLSLFPFILRKKISNIDLVRTHQKNSGLFALILKLFYKKKVVVRCGYEPLLNNQYTNALSWMSKLYEKLYSSILYKYCDNIIVTSERIKNFINDNFLNVNGKITVIPNCIDEKVFKKKQLKKINNSLLFIGRLNSEKNLISLIEGLYNSKYRLDIIGDGPERPTLINIIKKVDANVNFLGVISNKDLPDIINKYDLFILPSLQEGNPKSLLEAMSCESIVLGTDVIGIKEIITNGYNGLLCQANSKSIRESIDYYFDNKNKIIDMGLNARKTILKNYSIDKVSKFEIDLLSNIFKDNN